MKAPLQRLGSQGKFSPSFSPSDQEVTSLAPPWTCLWPELTYKLGQNINRERLAGKNLCKTSWGICFQRCKRKCGSLIWVWQAVGSEKSYIFWTVNMSLWEDVRALQLTWHHLWKKIFPTKWLCPREQGYLVLVRQCSMTERGESALWWHIILWRSVPDVT